LLISRTKTARVRTSYKEMAPQVMESPRSPAHRKVGTLAVDTTESSAPHAHPSTDYHDDTIEAHYACLERPCACLEGWVFVGYIDEDGEEREASYACRRCATSTH
jgi:hypothetical protein